MTTMRERAAAPATKWHVQLFMWLGGQGEGEGEDPFPYYTEDWGPFKECCPPQFLWGG